MSSVMTLYGKTNENSKSYDHTWLRAAFNLCHDEHLGVGNFVKDLILKSFHKYSSISFVCPVKVGPFYLKNFGLEFDEIPSFLLGRNRSWELIVVTKGKTSNMKSLLQMSKIKFFGATII